MQQRFRRLALFVGATSLAAGGLVMVACGTDNGTTPTPPLPEASTNKDTGGGGTDSATPDGGGTGTDGGGVDADCSKNPVLHDNTAGFRCPFITPVGDAGSNCTNTETCCETNDKLSDGGFQKSYCTAAPSKGTVDAVTTCKAGATTAGSSFDAGDAWECEDNIACGGAGHVCCMIVDPGQAAMGKTLGIGNTLATDKNHPPACGVQRAFNEGGSRCRTGATCPTGEKKLCSLSDMNCAAPTTCTPFVDFQQTHHGTCL